MFHPEDLDLMWSRVGKAMDPGSDGRYDVEYRVRQPDGSWRWLSAWGLAEFEGEGPEKRPVAIAGASRDITERKLAQARQELLTQEIHHRTKNLFAVVQAVVARSFAGKETAAQAREAVLSRLQSLAATHAMLIDKDWQGADMSEVVAKEMSPFAGRVSAQGPRVLLNPKAAQNFALAVHELATNAAKYGALSNAAGRVAIEWEVNEPEGLLIVRWQELDGPKVATTGRKGFGTAVLEHVMAEYGADAPRMQFQPEGVRYEVRCALSAIGTQD